ncbi:MAG: hypothetical protein AAGB93_12095 [Planctomycetota bacterium]
MEGEGDLDVASPLRVLGASSVLLALVAAAVFLALPRSAALDADELLGELFAEVEDPLPFALRVDGARALPTGARVVTFSRLPEAAAPDEGTPTEATVVEFPAENGDAIIGEQFRGLRFEGGLDRRGRARPGPSKEGKGGEEGKERSKKPRLQEKARFVWHGYDATFARMRHGGDDAFYDTVRVDLSTGGRCIIAYVRFPDGVDGDRDVAAALVRAFHPRG